jgi:c-di-GMP-binding flagellar brake protein YcgR
MIHEENYQRKTRRIDLSNQQHKIQYKFIDPKKSFVCNEVFTGHLLDLSEDGAQIRGPLPSLKLLNLLGDEKLYIGCVFSVLSYSTDGARDEVVKALSRIRWAQSDAHKGQSYHRMGLEFIKIPEADRCLIKNYIVRQQIRAAKINRTLDLLNPNN